MINTSISKRFPNISILLVEVAVICMAAAFININNAYPQVPLFLLLFFACTGLTFALDRQQAGLVALMATVLWIGVKGLADTWQEPRLLANLFELSIVLSAFTISTLFHDRLMAVFGAYDGSLTAPKARPVADQSNGPLSSELGRKRLAQEEARALADGAPLSLLLVQVLPVSGRNFSSTQSIYLLRSLAATVQRNIRRKDVLFIAAPDKMAILMPQTEIQKARKVAGNVMYGLLTGQFRDSQGQRIALREYAKLRYGAAVFTGNGQEDIDLLEAAELSLEQARQAYGCTQYHCYDVNWLMAGAPDDASAVELVDEMEGVELTTARRLAQ